MRFLVLFILFLIPKLFTAQLSVGQVYPNVTIEKVIGKSSTAKQLYDIKSPIIILDFFGTWCAPCIKGIPSLLDYEKNFGDSITSILVSIEQPEKLEKFAAARNLESLIVISEQEKHFHKIANPPSYPFTVILNQQYQVLAITNTSELNTQKISDWLHKPKDRIIDLPPMELPKNIDKTTPAILIETNRLLQLSQDFIYAAKSKEDVSSFKEKLKNIDFKTLQDSLPDDNSKKAFWINLYNAYVNSSLQQNADQYKKRSRFFKTKNIEIAGKKFSLDDIEHDLLRRSKIKWSLGYLNKLFPGKTEKALRVNKLDYRIHFALNCGAKSCPPIAFYNAASIHEQLTVATKSYLTSEADYNKTTDIVKLPAILSWFRKDFGGKKKMNTLLIENNIIPNNSNPTIKFKKYDWSIVLDNYKTDL